MLKLRSDEQLLAAFRDGNEEAFNVIFDRYRTRLLRYTRRMLGGSAAEAEDVLQDVFVRAYRSLAIDQRDLPLKAWLYRVAHNRCVDHLRRPITDEASVYEVNRPLASDPHAQTEQRETLRRLVRDVRELPDQQRSALLLRELEGLSYADVAATMDVTVPAVKSLLVRARGGLLDAQEAQDTACSEVRIGLQDARSRGVRMSGLARRHLLRCSDCRDYHAQLRGYERAVAALDGGPGPAAAFAKLLGFGSATGGSAAAASSGGAVVGVGGFGVLSAAGVKTIAILATTAVVTGGAVEVSHVTSSKARTEARAATPSPASITAPTAAPLALVHKLQAVTQRDLAARERATHAMLQTATAAPAHATPVIEVDAGDEAAAGPELAATGGATAPATLADAPAAETATETTVTETTPTQTTTATTPVSAGAGTAPPAVATTPVEPVADR